MQITYYNSLSSALTIARTPDIHEIDTGKKLALWFITHEFVVGHQPPWLVEEQMRKRF